ncbi:hypothetical protein JCM3775_007510 [Rhodotorula graminis]|uniref:Uncharacterized protein n=1 Tax=Rhodotorula graminis (strain WP1) TaxID=578459 RepID=A0A0P9EJP4_RHOGW|nr:uncharacterized protein RHOBADRAFT_67004 [Rhodotorula graminis WP1]KPV71879.1 hypothetical protein RHOBADRAFT_67004 [Rhodotorula graminis WP1]
MATANYSLLSIPATFVLGMAAHWNAIILSMTSKDLPPFDNRAPRAFLASVSQLAKTSADARQYLRAEAAQTNVFEQLGLFAAAVLCGNWARLPTSFLNKATGAYVALRVVYCVLYIKTDRAKFTGLRSIVWLASSVIALSLFVKSSTALNKALY